MYVFILNYFSGDVSIIKLTEQEEKQSEEYFDFSDFLETLEDRYEFRLKDCNWMVSESKEINMYVYDQGKEKKVTFKDLTDVR